MWLNDYRFFPSFYARVCFFFPSITFFICGFATMSPKIRAKATISISLWFSPISAHLTHLTSLLQKYKYNFIFSMCFFVCSVRFQCESIALSACIRGWGIYFFFVLLFVVRLFCNLRKWYFCCVRVFALLDINLNETISINFMKNTRLLDLNFALNRF